MSILDRALLLLFAFFASNAVASEIASFTVSTEVENTSIPAFTATIGAVGNGTRLSPGGGFEPVVFRTKFKATGGSSQHIQATPYDLTLYDSWAEGMLDGAEVEILRVKNGHFTSVRSSVVRLGGHRSSGWNNLFGEKVLSKHTTNIQTGWDRWNRPGAPYYYTVRAIDRYGRLSSQSNTVMIQAPAAKPGKVPEPEGLQRRKLSDIAALLNAPQNLRAHMRSDRTMELTWDPVSDAQGYIVYRSDVAPSQHRGYGLDLEETGPEVRSGDLVLIRHKLFAPKRADVVTSRAWAADKVLSDFAQPLISSFPDTSKQAAWSLEKHKLDTPVTGAGETYLLAELSPDRHLNIGSYNHSGTAQTWYDVLDPTYEYVLEVWLKGEAGVTATAQLPDRQQDLTVSSEWQRHRLRFRVPELYRDKRPRKIGIVAQGEGQIAIDNYRIYRADTPYLAFLPEEKVHLRASGMGQLRTHGFVKTGRRTYDLTQLTNVAGGSNATLGNTLPQTLAAIHSVGMDPWLQIEPHFSRDEWLGLVEFLAAPFDPKKDQIANKPWAAKRYLQGQIKPYTQVFKQIRFEVGNETWNRLFSPWTFSPMEDAVTGVTYSAAQVYGLYQAYVLSIMRQSPYWRELDPILRPIIGGWTINDYGQQAARLSPRTPLVAVAEYNGGWDQGEGVVSETPEGFASVLGFAPQTVANRSAEHISNAEEIARRRGTALAMGTYEAGPGYARNGLNGSQVSEAQKQAQERVMKSAAAGTATLDTFLTQARAGYRVQNYFRYGTGDYWRSHALWFNGGQAYPAWQWLSVVNRQGQGLGDLLAVKVHDVPRRNLPKMARREAFPSAPMVDVYPLIKLDQLILVVVSRLVPDMPRGNDGMTNVTIALPFSQVESIEKLSMSGDLRSHNLYAPNAMILREHITVADALPKLKIKDFPPGEVQIYIFDGVKP